MLVWDQVCVTHHLSHLCFCCLPWVVLQLTLGKWHDRDIVLWLSCKVYALVWTYFVLDCDVSESYRYACFFWLNWLWTLYLGPSRHLMAHYVSELQWNRFGGWIFMFWNGWKFILHWRSCLGFQFQPLLSFIGVCINLNDVWLKSFSWLLLKFFNLLFDFWHIDLECALNILISSACVLKRQLSACGNS